MHVGVFNFATDYSMPVDELARALEERGFESLFLPEHTHIPTSRKTPWPGGAELPKEYSHTHDPFVALAVAAANTSKLKVGTGICLVPQRDPIVTAKSIASVDMLSNGRFIFGIGAGWNQDEMENHGTVYKARFRIMREHVLAMKALWTEEEAEYHGEFVNFDPVWCYPKPQQRPHPPILLGGESEHTMKRIVEFCDGWFPRARFGFDVVSGMASLKAVADQAGRDMSTISITVFGAKPDRATLDSYVEAGVERSLLGLPTSDRDATLKKLDEFAALIA